MRVSTLTLAAALTIAPALVHPASLEAQRTRRPAHREEPARIDRSMSHTRVFFAAGWRQIDVDGLNAALTGAGYPAVAEDFVSLGGGAQLVAGRVMLGLEGFGLLGTDAEVSRDQFDARLAGGYGALTVGFSAVATPRFRLYPMGQLGVGTMTLDIVESARVSFDEVLTEPRRGAELGQVSLLAGAGLGMELLAPLRSGSSRMLSIGLAGGYTFAPVTSRWQLHGNEFGAATVTGGPELGIEGPFARLTIGFASMRGR